MKKIYFLFVTLCLYTLAAFISGLEPDPRLWTEFTLGFMTPVTPFVYLIAYLYEDDTQLCKEIEECFGYSSASTGSGVFD